MSTLRSMTGFAALTADDGTYRVEVQIRSVNHKQLEVRWAGPSEWAGEETSIVARVKAHVHRGRVDVRVRVEAIDEAAENEMGQVMRIAEKLRAMATTAQVSPVFGLPELIAAGALNVARGQTPMAEEALALANRTLEDSLHAFIAFRTREGAALAATFDTLLSTVGATVEQLEGLRMQELAAYQLRMSARVRELLASSVALDEARIAAEIALLAERSDIAEELQRSRAHLVAVRELLSGPGPHGKRLDFLLQELIRETNTMASKALSSAVTHLVVDAKTAVERMREQAHNLE